MHPPPPPHVSSPIDKSALLEVIEPVCRAHGVELVDVTLTNEHGAVLRVLIDREGPVRRERSTGKLLPTSGVSLADCQSISRDLSTVLDVHDRLVPTGRYRLEVSSPGVDRPLVRPRDFERFLGTEVRVHVRTPLDETGRRRVQGTLAAFDGERARVEDASGASWLVPLSEIIKAHVVFRFE